jgi:hypothetical protein
MPMPETFDPIPENAADFRTAFITRHGYEPNLQDSFEAGMLVGILRSEWTFETRISGERGLRQIWEERAHEWCDKYFALLRKMTEERNAKRTEHDELPQADEQHDHVHAGAERDPRAE